MTRYLFPELFHVVGAQIPVKGKARTALRWILHTSLGLPRALFRVWRYEKSLPTKGVALTQRTLDGGERLVTWNEGPAAAIALTVTVPAGASFTMRAHSGATAVGHVVDVETVVGPATNASVVLFGSPLSSVTATGNGTITATATIVAAYDLINADGWKLLETVGLPVDKSFGGTGYPLDKQGPVGSELEPFDAAIRRVKEGSIDTGWPATTDRGTAVPAFVPPDASALVLDELKAVREQVRTLLRDVANPAEHAKATVHIKTRAPRSIHGVDAPARWQDQAQDADVQPLVSLLLPAATDSYAALALGFGTTVDVPAQLRTPVVTHVSATNPRALVFLMVTVEHEVKMQLPAPLPPVTLSLAGELAALYVEPQNNAPAVPNGVSALSSAVHLDPPGVRDGRWLEAVRVGWAAPQTLAGSQARPTAYAVARGFGTGAMEIQLEKRAAAGGWRTFVAASPPREQTPASVEYVEAGLPEVFPSEPNTAVYAVAATDWFGRWSGWASADHPRASVAPQVPATRDIQVDVPSGTARVEFTWDWSHRSPKQITVRVVTPDQQVDRVLDFSTATIDTPPAGVELIAGESRGNLRTYRVAIPGITFAFNVHPRITLSARTRATERVGFGAASAWSPERTTMVASPLAPPPPFVPAQMWWASVPDPRGVARSTLTWTGSAPSYVVYVADETAIRRELGLPSADLGTPPEARLPALRALDFGAARRAFKRLAGPLAQPSLPVELSRGSKLIHFYGIAPVGVTGVEGPLPAAGNAYFAVAAPRILTPEAPRLLARDAGGVVTLSIEVPETHVPVGRVTIHRAPNRARAVTLEHAGPPIAVLDGATAVRANGIARFTFQDIAPGRAWQPVFYRAVARATTDPSRGVYGGSSEATRAIDVVVTSATAPSLSDLRVEDVAAAPAHRLVSFLTDATLVRSTRGAHTFALQTIAADAQVGVRRVSADALPLLLQASAPAPTAQPDTIFRFHATDPRSGRNCAWVPRDVRAIVVEIADPSGRTTRQTWRAP
ncbi:hypothetical protein LVJ94_07125 [Pendulispora rubella]|uniref:Uncharacterized protein n=1 Tax=Pendulispora rubella TaxID=2741070 RepID=A0ABZ2LAR2_9BACT